MIFAADSTCLFQKRSLLEIYYSTQKSVNILSGCLQQENQYTELKKQNKKKRKTSLHYHLTLIFSKYRLFYLISLSLINFYIDKNLYPLVCIQISLSLTHTHSHTLYIYIYKRVQQLCMQVLYQHKNTHRYVSVFDEMVIKSIAHVLCHNEKYL